VKILLAALVVSASLLFASSAAARGYWGAIAVDPESGAIGKSFDFPTAKAAQRQAIAVCEVRGNGCKVAVWVTNGWAALVKKHSGVYIGGLGRSKHLAILDARRRAHEASAHLVATVFSG
jgi:Domain of unknown function (DUF4189)